MTPKFVVPATLALLAFASPVLHAAGSGDMEKEYQQIRAVALRDPKVKAAYAEADRKLEAKIVQIDPALAGYRSHGTSEPEKTTGTTKPAATAKSTSSTKPAAAKGGFHAPHSTAAAAGNNGASSAQVAQTTHTVAPGDTLGAIASHYGVTVAALKSTNHITDEKKLVIGENLIIPAKKAH